MLKIYLTNIETIYDSTNKKIQKIKAEYRYWIEEETRKANYIRLTSGLVAIVDKIIEWEKKDKEIMEVYINLIKDLRERMQVLETNEEYKKINEIYTGLMKKKGVKESVSRLDTKEEMDNTFTCIEMFYGNKNQKKLCIDVIKQEYENWIGFWGGIYIQLVIGLTVIVDKIIEWEKKDKEIMEVYINLIKDLRERMQVLETE